MRTLTRGFLLTLAFVVGMLAATWMSPVLAQRQSSTTQYVEGATDFFPLSTAVGWFDGTAFHVASTAHPLPVSGLLQVDGSGTPLPISGAFVGSQSGASFSNGNYIAMMGCVSGNTTPGTATNPLPGAVDKNSPVFCGADGRPQMSVVVTTAAGAAVTFPTDPLDESAFVDATSSVLSIGFVARSSLDTLTTGKVGASNMTLSRNAMFAAAPDNSALLAVSPCYPVSTASTNATSCAAAAANFYGGWFINTSVTIGYVRFYNLSSAPTCSSATGFINSVPIPPAAAAGGAGGIVYLDSLPVNFTTGIGWCITGGGTSTDNTNAPAGIYGTVRYKT